MTKSLRIENVIQFVNHDQKSKMKNKFDDIFNSWKDNSFPYQPKKIFKLFRFTIFFIFTRKLNIDLHTNYWLA